MTSCDVTGCLKYPFILVASRSHKNSGAPTGRQTRLYQPQTRRQSHHGPTRQTLENWKIESITTLRQSKHRAPSWKESGNTNCTCSGNGVILRVSHYLPHFLWLSETSHAALIHTKQIGGIGVYWQPCNALSTSHGAQIRLQKWPLHQNSSMTAETLFPTYSERLSLH